MPSTTATTTTTTSNGNATTALSLPLFPGQGTPPASSAPFFASALEDARASPAAGTLLAACFEAFHAELSSLSAEELVSLGIDLTDFRESGSLLGGAELGERYRENAILNGTRLFLAQALRYLSFVQSQSPSSSFAPFSETLAQSAGALGFSSGVLPAVVVAASPDLVSYLANGVQGYRLALWIGVRAQGWRVKVLAEAGLAMDTAETWGTVVMGLSREGAEALLRGFEASSAAPLYITAVLDAAAPGVTISGRPDVLAAFASTLPSQYIIHKTTLDTLYHAPVHAEEGGVRDAVLADVERRGVRFPAFADLRVPVRSNFTGEPLTRRTPSGSGAGSLAEVVVDMILTQPVEWGKVVAGIKEALPATVGVRMVNVGPGTGLVRAVERAFEKGRVQSVEIARGASKDSDASGKKEHVGATQARKQEPIAIVGMAVNMPGAPDAAALWQVLEDGINTISEIPEHRFKVSSYNAPANPATKRQMKAHTGNFLSNADEFDNRFFKISPREAKSMDPQQRVLLHAAYAALEDAGYVPGATETWQPERVGVYVGVATGDYVQNLREEIDVYYSTGTLRAFLSGRISFAMQLSGPSIVIDTACSSSNVALYQGARALMNGDCDAALVGGVNVVSSPDMFLGLDRGHFLSPTGQCAAFDASANGYSRSEGCGVFVLKRLSAALAENDNILGVIRGVEVNQSGLAHSITYPHAATQASLFRTVLSNAGISAERVNVVEAHGTGTQAGDPNEVESLRSVLALNRPANNPLHITSVKANIGHLEAASGAAGLAKLLLMLKHKRIPKQISLKMLNPRIAPLADDNTVIDTTEVAWEPSDKGMTRVALLNNFGAAGSNTAVLLEEHVRPVNTPADGETTFVIGLSAKTLPALEELRVKYIAFLRSSPASSLPLPDIADVAYTATARRQLYTARLAVTASSHAQLIEKLSTATAGEATNAPAQAVWVFSGQGGAYLGMGRALYTAWPVVRACVDECEAILKREGFPGVLSLILAKDGEKSGLGEEEEVQAYQTAIFALECALARLWGAWGVQPTAVVGHSLGEYAALVTAGVLSMKDALLLVAQRVRLMVRKCEGGSTSMLAVNMGPRALEGALRSTSSTSFSDLSIACYNSPADCVLSGPIPQLKAFKAHLDSGAASEGVRVKSALLAVPFGYHSTAMAPLLDDLTAAARRVALRPPTLPIISNVLGDVVLPGDASVFTASYFARHCAEPVQFERGIRALASRPEFASIDAYIELGPHTTSLPMLKANPAVGKDALLLGSLKKGQKPDVTLAGTLAQLYASNLAGELKWREVFGNVGVRCVSLPAYPLARTKYWVAFQEEAAPPAAVAVEKGEGKGDSEHLIGEFAMLGRWAQYPAPANGGVAVFETPISELASSIVGHSVGGLPLCPASVYIELVFAGVELGGRHLKTEHHDAHVVLRRTEFEKPLVYDAGVARTVVTRITLGKGEGKFSVGSRVGGGAEEVHVQGEFRFQATLRTTTKFVQTLPVITRHIAAVVQPQGGNPPEVFSTRTAYEVIFPRVVDYSKQYHTMQTLTVDASGMEGVATVQLPADYDRSKFVVHPVWMDTLLHVAGFVANMHGGLNDAYICTQVGAVKVFPALVNNDKPYLVYCNNAWLPDENVMLAEAYAVQVAEPRRIVAHMKGMHFRRLRLSSLKKSLAHAAGKSVVHAPQPAKAVRIAQPMSHGAPSPPPPVVDVDAVVIKLVSDTCDVPVSAVDLTTDLASIGIDSMMSIEIFGGLRSAFPDAELDAQVLSFCTTVADICREVAAKVKTTGKAAPSLGMTQTVSESTSSPRTLLEPLEPETSLPDGAPDVIQILSSVLEVSIDSLGADADLDALGLDSLTSIEALHALKTEFGLDLPNDFFTRYPTPRAVQAYIAGPKFAATKGAKSAHASVPVTIVAAPPDKSVLLEGSPRPADAPLSASLARITKALQLDTVPVPIQRPETSGRLPLFFIHDGSGLVNYYDRLSFLDRAIWGIHNPRFASGRPWDGVVDMAAAYVDYILSTTSGPLLLGGWSFGGVAAYEIALQLTSRGIQVKGILLIDSPSPINHIPLSDSLLDTVIDLDARAARSELSGLVKKQFSMNAGMLGKYVPHATASLCPPLVLLRSSEGFHPAGVTDIPTWLADRSDPQTSVAGWQSLAHCSVKVLDIPGHHFQPFHSSNIAELSLRIADGCEYLESL